MRGLIHFCLGAALALLALEVGLRLLPVSTATHTGYSVDPDILTYPPHHVFTTAAGWDLQHVQRLRANNAGFVAVHDFVAGSDAVGLIGDSYVEASALPAAERLAARLEARWNGRPVYAFGAPGSSLLDYAARIDFAHRRFGLRDFVVVLERFDLFQAICGSGQIHAHCLDRASGGARIERQAPPGLLKRVARESALAQYLFSQLKLSLASLLRHTRPGAPQAQTKLAATELPAPLANAVIDRFLAMLPADAGLRLVVVIEPGPAGTPGPAGPDAANLELLARRLRAAGILVVDPAPAFREDIARHGRSLQIAPHDGHWNARAVDLIATAIGDPFSRAGKADDARR